MIKILKGKLGIGTARSIPTAFRKEVYLSVAWKRNSRKMFKLEVFIVISKLCFIVRRK